MNDRRHLRKDDDVDKERPAAPRHEQRQNPHTASILDLQGSVGNRAVAQLLELQRQPADKAPGAEPANEGQTSAVGSMSIPEMELVMPILSFSQQAGQPNQPKTASGEVAVTVALASLDPRIQEAAAKGKQFATITLSVGSKSTFTFHSVVFSSFQIGSDTATLSLNFTSMEFTPSE